MSAVCGGLLRPRETTSQLVDELRSVERDDIYLVPSALRKEMDFVASLFRMILKGPVLAGADPWMSPTVSCNSLQRSAGLRVQRVV